MHVTNRKFFAINFKLRQNWLLDKQGFPYNLRDEYPRFFTKKTRISLSNRDTTDFSPKLMDSFFCKFEELKILRSNIYIHFNCKAKEIWLNREFWGGDYIKANIGNAALLWFISVSNLKFILPEFIADNLQRKPAREVVYDLRYANLKKSEIVKLFSVPRANVYRWIEEFEKSEEIRRKNECVYRTLHSLYCENGKNNYKWQKFINRKETLEFRSIKYSYNELVNIDNLNGKMKNHIRRTKRQLAAEKMQEA